MKKSVINLSLFPEIPAKIENYSNGRGGGQTFKKMRERVNKHKRCDGCLFYHLDDEDTGTCIECEPTYDFELTRSEIDLAVDALTICSEGWGGGIDSEACQALIAKLKEAR